MGHHIGAVANADPIKPINGKRLILILGVGAFIFTVVMGFGTYALAQLMTPMLKKNAPKVAGQRPITTDSTQKKS